MMKLGNIKVGQPILLAKDVEVQGGEILPAGLAGEVVNIISPPNDVEGFSVFYIVILKDKLDSGVFALVREHLEEVYITHEGEECKLDKFSFLNPTVAPTIVRPDGTVEVLTPELEEG